MTAPVLARLHAAYAGREWVPVTAGRSGAGVWHLPGRPGLYLKVALPSPHPDSGFDLGAEADRLRWLAGTGVPAPEPVDVGSTVDGVSWLVTTAVPGRTAAADWPPHLRADVVDALADLARTLHAYSPARCPYDRSLATTVPHARQAVALGLVDLADLDSGHRGWTGEQLLSTMERSRPSTEDIVVCHGDLCLPNVLLDPDTRRVTGVVDVGRLGRADRYADLALLTRSLTSPRNRQYGPAYARRLVTRYGLDTVDNDRIAFYRLLDEFF